jgi:multiple sugar transport system substrate-binding protein
LSEEKKEEKAISRRKYLGAVGGVGAAAAVGWGLAGYLASRPPAPAAVRTVTETKTVTATPAVTAIPTTPTGPGKYWTPTLDSFKNLKQYFKGVTLNGMDYPTPTAEAVMKVLPEFEDLTGITVNYETADFDVMRERYTGDFVAKTGSWDLVSWAYQLIPEWANAGYLVPLEKFLNDPDVVGPYYNIDDIIESIWRVQIWRKDFTGPPYHYMICSKSDIFMMVYRKDLFEDPKVKASFEKKYGYELAPPKDYNQLMDVAEFFTKSINPDSPVEYGFIQPYAVGDPICCSYYPLLFGFGTDFFDENMYPIFDNPAAVAALDYLKGLLKYAPPGANTMHYDPSFGVYQTGKAAIMFNWDAFFPALEDPSISPAVAGKNGYAMTPGGYSLRPSLGGWGWGINAFSKNQLATWKLIEFLTHPEMGVKLALAGAKPGRWSALENPEVKSKWPWISAFLDILQVAHFRPLVLSFTEAIDETVGKALSAAVLGEKSSFDALHDAVSEIYKIMERNGYYKRLPIVKEYPPPGLQKIPR